MTQGSYVSNQGRSLQAAFRAELEAILARGLASGEFVVPDPTVTIMGIIAFGEFAPAWFRSTGRLSAEQVATHYASLAVKMVQRGNP